MEQEQEQNQPQEQTDFDRKFLENKKLQEEKDKITDEKLCTNCIGGCLSCCCFDMLTGCLLIHYHTFVCIFKN